MARPKKQPGEKRDQRFNLRFTTAEIAYLKTEAERTGLNLHEYARRRALGAKVTTRRVNRADPALISELNRIGVNLNQLMPMGHLRKDISDECEEALSELRRILELVMVFDGAETS